MTIGRLAKWIATAVWDAGWAPLLVLVAHALAAVVLDAYRRIPSLDMLMHFAGGTAMAWFLHRASITASEAGILGPFHPVTHVALVGSLTCVAALAWEIAEFALDQTLGTRYQPDLPDTMIDLLLGIAGGTSLLIAVGLTGRLRRPANNGST